MTDCTQLDRHSALSLTFNAWLEYLATQRQGKEQQEPDALLGARRSTGEQQAAGRY